MQVAASTEMSQLNVALPTTPDWGKGGAGGLVANSTAALDRRAAAERNLWYWNLACAIAHGVQAVAALALGLGSSTIAAFKLPLTTVFLDWDTSLGYPVQVLKVQARFPSQP